MLRIWLEIGLGDFRSEDLQTPRAAIYSMWCVISYPALNSLLDDNISNNWMIDLTWANVPILGSNKVDHLVSLCDSAEHVRSSSVQWATEANIPFGVFPSHPVPYSLDYGAPLKDEEAFLFKDYVDHVALIMMPYDDQRNP
jgi:Fungal specific transcription factor domain